MKRSKSERLSKYLLFVVFALISIAYLPGIIGGPWYKVVTAPLYCCIGLLCMLNFRYASKPVYGTILQYACYVSLISCITYALTDFFPASLTLNVFMSMLCFFIGFSLRDKSENLVRQIAGIYIVFAAILGLYSVLKVTGGFVIADQYLFKLKNSSGAILGTAECILLCMIANTKTKKWIIVQGILWLSILACILTFQCRTAFIGVMAVTIANIANRATFHKLFSSPVIFFAVLAIIVSVLTLDIIPTDFIYDAVTANRDISDANDMTSGRVNFIEKGWRYYEMNPLTGALGMGVRLKSIDSMAIAVLCKYGLVGALLIFPPYLYLWWVSIKGCVKANPKQMLPYAIMFFLCITSLAEETYPFGPGTPIVGGFIFLGMAMRSDPDAFFSYKRDVLRVN